MEPTKQQTEELKRVELDLLRAFISLCEQLSLRYYLVEGTLLGAVRHGGFIPWDDDIDVAMPRADYEVLLARGQALLPSHLFLQSIHAEEEYILPFAKLRNSDTAFMETSARPLHINKGVYIDIFPLDFYPERPAAGKRLGRKKRQYDARIAAGFYTTQKRNLKGKLVLAALKLLYPSLRKTVLLREKTYLAVPESPLLTLHGSAWGRREIVPACWYGAGVAGSFEGIPVRLPAEYDRLLSQVYGDYMQLPPEEKRVAHHHTDVIDLTKSYREYQNNK